MEETEKKCAWNNGKLVGDLPKEKRNAVAVSAGKASGETRRKRRAARDVLLDILHSQTTDKDMESIAKIKGIETTELATLLLNMTRKASKSANMAELVFKLTGDLQDQPTQQITIVNQLSDEQLEQERKRILDSTSDIIDITPEPPDLDG
jgi:hypothetical protein